MTPAEVLDDILSNGIQVDLFRAEQCFALRGVIGEHAGEINTAHFGDFFANLQQILHQFAYLSLAKPFEPPHNRYPLRSIPVALHLLNKHSQELPIVNPYGVIETLVKLGHKEEDLKGLTNVQLSSALYNEYKQRLPEADDTSPNKLSRVLYAIKTTRDKFISHHEAINLADLPVANFEDITELIQFGLEFLQTVGRGYLSVSYSGTVGEFLKTTDAARASRGLGRLLQKLGIANGVSAE